MADTPVGISLPTEMGVETDFDTDQRQMQKAVTPYAIPPAVWMFAFLIVGYLGLRYLLED